MLSSDTHCSNSSHTFFLPAVDHYEFARLDEGGINTEKLTGVAGTTTNIVEHRPMFHEWATVLPGMICVSRKARNQTFRNYVAAETATPVISCCACLEKTDEKQWFFAGIARSKSVRPVDDGIGPSTDEFFTVAIGGMATLLNNSSDVIYPGDILEWTFYSESTDSGKDALKRMKSGPRRLGVKVADAMSERVIGRALTFSKPSEQTDSDPPFTIPTDITPFTTPNRSISPTLLEGEMFDLLIRGC